MFDGEVAFDMCRFFAHKDQHGVVMYTGILGCLHLLEQTEINSRMIDRAMSIVLALGGNALLGHVTPSNTLGMC